MLVLTEFAVADKGMEGLIDDGELGAGGIGTGEALGDDPFVTTARVLDLAVRGHSALFTMELKSETRARQWG